MSYRAVIFDLDGTLIDSERLVFEAGEALLTAHGVPEPRRLLASLVGAAADDGRRRAAEAVAAHIDPARFETLWLAAAHDAFAQHLPLRPGADALLERLAAVGLPFAIATNSSTASALKKLGQSGLMRHFDPDLVVGVDAAPRPKPAPDLFLEAAQRLDAAPADCLAFEDSDHGVAAALAAGMQVVQVPDMAPPRAGAAHFLADNLMDGARAAGLFR